MKVLAGVNLALAFALELVAWVVLALAASRLVDGTIVRLVVGVTAFAAVTTGWGLLAAPKARVPYAATRIVTKVVVFGGATAALAGLGHPLLAGVFALLVVINLTTSPNPRRSPNAGR